MSTDNYFFSYQIAPFLAMAWLLYRRPILRIGSYSQLPTLLL